MVSLDDIKSSLRAEISVLNNRIGVLESEVRSLETTLEQIEAREKIVEETERDKRFEKAQAKVTVPDVKPSVVPETPFKDPLVNDVAEKIERYNKKNARGGAV